MPRRSAPQLFPPVRGGHHGNRLSRSRRQGEGRGARRRGGRRLFLPALPLTPSFAPVFIINELAVDIAGLERVARSSATELAYRASEGIRTQRLRSTRSVAPNGTIIAEGNSWFNLPDIAGLVPPTLVDILAATRPIDNIAHWGDTLAQMVMAGEYAPYLATGKVEHFLFSAGGNDALGGGNLAAYIRQRESGDNDPANAPLYVKPSYYAMADGVEAVYRALLSNVRTLSPSTVVVIHGYDYCLPRKEGSWLGGPLRFRGFDPVFQRDFARAIVRVLVDDFNIRLERLASSFVNVEYVDLRGAADEDEWWDELHPKRAAAKKYAQRIGDRLGASSRGARAARRAAPPARRPATARRPARKSRRNN